MNIANIFGCLFCNTCMRWWFQLIELISKTLKFKPKPKKNIFLLMKDEISVKKETVFSLLILLFSQSKYIAAKIYFRFFLFKQMRKKIEKFIKWKIKETNGIKVYILSVMSGHIEWTSSFYFGVTAYYMDETKKIRYEETYIICDIHSHW